MSIIDDLLNTYSTPATVPEAKKKAVELTSAEKLKALGGIKPDTFENVAIATQGDNQGAYSASPIETDLRNLRDYELRDKYGEEAQQLIDARTQGNIGIGVKKDFANSGTGALGTTQDVLVGAGHGLAGLAGGLAYLGTAGVDALAGTTASNDVATANKAVLDWINSGHTDENTIDTVVNTKQGALNRRDTKQLYDERISDPNASKVDAFLRRIGQDFVDEVGNTASSPEQLTNLTGEAIGSIGGIGALTKAGTKVGTKILEGLTAKGVVEEGSKTVAALEKYGKEAFTTAMIGATEGGSVGAEAANKVLDMKIADLLKDPVQGKRIAALVADVGEEKAKEILAKEVGLSVAGKAAVIGAATGKLVSKFEGNPLAGVTSKQAYANLAAQSVEETLQEGGGQLLTNYEIGQKVKSNQDLAEDVGSNAAKGFLGGALGTATFNPVALSKPIVEPSAKAAKWLASETVKPIVAVSKWLGNKAAGAFKNKLGEVNTGVLSNIAKASPISNERVAKAAQAITETVAPAQQVIQTIKENPEATEGNIKAAEYVSKLTDALKFEVPPEGAMPPLFEKELSGVTTTVEAAQKLVSIVDRKDVSEEDRFIAIENLHGLMTGVSDALLDGAEDALTEMENLPELQAYADNFTGLFNSFKDSPAMQGAIKHFDTILQVGVNLGHYKEIDVNNLADPDQQANLNKILNVASTTKASIPENIAQQINTISDMLTDSDMATLTPQQKNQIRGLAEELKIAKALSEKAKAMGLASIDIVNRQVSLDDAEERTFKYPSAREHSRGIVAAMAKGDLSLAKKRLETLQNFAVHFSNKIAALNEHIATAKPGVSSTVKYMAYRSAMGQEWSESKKGVYVNFNKQSSVELAKTIALEGLALGNIYNQLTKAYPELELKSFKVSEIDPKVTKGTSLDTVRDELLGKSPSTPTPTPTGTGTGTGEDLTKWTDVLNKHKGIANLNTNKDKLTQEDAEEVIAALKTLPTNFKTATKALGKSLNELRKYFGLPEGYITTDEDGEEDADADADEDNDNNDNDPTPMDRWDKLLNRYGGIARLNANKEKFSNKLAESVYKILDALPKDFTMKGEYQKEFEEFKEYFLGKEEDSEPEKKVEPVTTSTPAAPTTPVTGTGIVVPMNYYDGQDASHVMRPEFKGKSTMDLILSGDRTATTGSLDRFKGLTKGTVFTVENKNTGQKAQVRATTNPYLVSEVTAEEWSKLEGWSPSLYAKYRAKVAYQIQYELVNKPTGNSSTPTKKFSWGRESKDGYEVSSSGDSRFSALTAKLKDGRTIEEAYQLDVKGYRVKGNNWKLGKGKAPLIELTLEESWKAYKALWEQWAFENKALMQELANKANGKTLTDKFANTDINQARALSEILNENPTFDFKEPKNVTKKLEVASESSSVLKPEDVTNHSGGALGSDSLWDELGQLFGKITNKHYWATERTPKGNTIVTNPDYIEGTKEAAKAANRNFGYQYATMKNALLIRNWSQVKYADAIFAIGSIVGKGEPIFPNIKGDTRTAINPSVTGGTGYAVGMGIIHKKPVYVFNQTATKNYEQGWYVWDNTAQDFKKTDVPALTKNFAGIGTRNINEAGKQAIMAVFTKAFGKSKGKLPTTETPKENQLEITKDSILSVDYPTTIEISEGTYDSAMQALTVVMYRYVKKTEHNYAVLQEALATSDPDKLREIQGKYKDLQKNFNDKITEAMSRIIHSYVHSHPEVAEYLQENSQAELVFKDQNTFWKGRLSKIYEAVLSELKAISKLPENGKITAKPTLKNLFTNLLSASKFLEAFVLGSKNEDILLNQTSPLSYLVSKLDTEVAEDSSFKKQAKQAWRGLLATEVPNVVDGLNTAVQDFLSNRIKMTSRTTNGTIAKIAISALRDEDIDPVVAQALKDAGISSGDLEGISQLIIDEGIIKSIPKKIEKLENDKATYKKQMPKNYTVFWEGIDEKIAKLKEELEKTADNLKGNLLYPKLNTLKGILVDKQGEIPLSTLVSYRELSRTPAGKILGLVEHTGEEYVISPRIAETIAVAALSWLANTRLADKPVDSEQAAKILGIKETAVTAEHLRILNKAQHSTVVIQEIADTVESFLDVKENTNNPLGTNEGLMLSIAGNVLDALVERGFVSVSNIQIRTSDATGNAKDVVKEYNFFTAEGFNGTIYKQVPEVVEEVVSEEFAKRKQYFVGSPQKMKVPNNVNHHPIPLTQDQKDMVDAAQQIPNYINTPVLDFFNAIGSEGLVYLFANGELDEDLMHPLDFVAKKGKNDSIANAWEKVQTIVKDITDKANFWGTKAENVAVYFGKGVTSVSRLQYSDAYNMQSSKIARPVIVATKKKVDLTKPEEEINFLIGIAQGMGVKVHNFYDYNAIAKLNNILGSEEVKAVFELLDSKKSQYSSEDLEVLKKVMPLVDNTEWGLTNLVEYHRFLRANTNQRKSFEHAVATEADGVTNGSANSLHILSGEINEELIELWRMTGYFIGNEPRTLNEEREDNPTDIYLKTALVGTDLVAKNIPTMKNSMSSENGVIVDDVISLMKLFNVTVKVNPSGDLELTRPSTKNPTTVTLYGSGEKGISEKILGELLAEIYAEISLKLQGKGKLMDEYVHSETARILSNLSTYSIIRPNPDSNPTHPLTLIAREANLLKFPAFNASPAELKAFVVNADSHTTLVSNISKVYTDPLSKAIEKVVGKQTGSNTDEMIYASTLQAQIMRSYYHARIREAIENKLRTDPLYIQSDYLSKQELEAIRKETMDKFGGLYSDQYQNSTVYLTTLKSSLDGLPYTGASLKDTNRAFPVLSDFDNPSVSIAPNMVIRADGLAIQHLINDPENDMNMLYIFDGIMMNTSDIKKGSLLANKAVFRTWTEQTPMRLVADSFKKAVDAVDFDNLLPELVVELIGYFKEKIPAEDKETDVSPKEQVMQALDHLASSLDTRARLIESQQALVKALPGYTDQMAAVGMPHYNEGTITQEELDAGIEKNGLVNFLKQKQMEILLTKEPNKKTSNPVKVIKSKDYIEKTRDSLATLAPASAAVVTAVIDAFKQSDYTIIIGSMKDASVELEKRGLTEAANHAKSKSGGAFVSHKDKVIVSSEDKDIPHLHELIHASTSTSLAFGLSDTVATTASEKRAKYAAKQLRILLAEFLSEEFVSNFEPNSEGESFYLKIKDKLLTRYANDEFNQISEMLAYLLPDSRTYDGLLKANTKASIPAKFLEAIKKAISYFFGSISEEHKNGFYANLVFHASSLAYDNMTFTNEVGISNYTEESTRLSLLTARLRGLIKSDLDSSKPLEKSQKTLAMVKQVKEMKVIHEAGFRLNQEETDAYSAMLLATKLGLNTNSSASTQLQEVFSRVVANVTPESFYPNKNPSSLQKEIALDKYDALFGRYKHGKRVHEDILANFVALASVSSEVRDIVSKVLAKQQQVDNNPSDVFDTFMGNLGDRITSGITQYAGNAIKVPKSSVDYLDALVDVLFSSDENRTIKENTMMQDLGAKADSLNDWLADAIQKGSSKLNTSTEGLRSSNNKALKTVGNITKLVNTFVNKDLAEVAALDINKSMNRKEGFQELRDLMRDLIGRTEDNALIYDLVKPIRVSVDKLRQNYKTQVPIAIQGKFKNKLGTTELKSLGISLAKTGIGVIGSSNVIRLATGKMNAQDEIAKLEQYLADIDGNYAQGVKDKAKQLANYNINGIAGNMLLRNPEAIARQFGMPSGNKPQITKAYINKVSELVALYSYEELNQQDKDILSRIAELDSEALVFTTRFLDLIRAEDKQSAEINLDAKANIYFGYLPQNSTKEGSLIVAADTEYADLIAKGYTRVGDYVGDSRDPFSKTSRGYFYNPVDLGQEYRQGVLQNIRSSTMGVDLESGLSTSRFSAGVIADPKLVEKILKSPYQDNASGESLLPIFNSAGRVIAFERPMSNKQIEAMVLDTDISKLLGSMRGRQIEESTSRQFLTTVAEALKSTYDSDPDKTQYVDLFDMKEVSKDKVLAFGVDMLSHAAKEEIRRVFGNSFYVKREMLTDVVGFRKASVTDVFTGVSRLSPETVTALRQIALSVFGKSAYKYMAYSEKYLQDGVSFIKANIVVKSVVVPVANILSNALHLASLGIPLSYTVNQVPKKVAELEYYMKVSRRLIQLEVEIAAAVNRDNQLANRLYAEKKSIDSALSKLSIAPLIEAGELSNINDVGLGAEDSLLFSGRLGEYMSALTDKTPSGLRAVGRHLLLAKDTALYEGLQKSVLYGDFIAKSVQYDYLTKVKKVPSKEAVVTVSAEFISYDHLPGRGRDYLESIGLLWFYNYKLRAVKVAANTIRNNPLYALMYAGVGGSQLGIDSPIDSNVVSQVFDGSIGYSLGIGMGIDGIFANPYGQLIH